MRNEIFRYNHIYGQEQEGKEHFYGEPVAVVKEIPSLLSGGKALDIGAGDGRHAIFLAEHGFDVTALDTSPVGLEKIHHIAEKKSLHLQTEVVDVATWDFSKQYDAIVVAVTLQHLKEADALAVLQKMKEHTNPGGVNAIVLFTNNGDRYLLDQEEDPGAFYPPDGWLREYYKDWEIQSYEEVSGKLVQRKRSDGTPMENMTARMLARKPV